MAQLAEEITLVLRWPHRPEDGEVLASGGSQLPLSSEAVVGSHAVKSDASYEVLVRSGRNPILHVSGRIPENTKTAFFTAEAWVRCQVNDSGECEYEVHVGPAGLEFKKACHRGRIKLAVK